METFSPIHCKFGGGRNSAELQLATSIPITLSRMMLDSKPFPSWGITAWAAMGGVLTPPICPNNFLPKPWCLSHPSHYLILHCFPLYHPLVNKYLDKCNIKLHTSTNPMIPSVNGHGEMVRVQLAICMCLFIYSWKWRFGDEWGQVSELIPWGLNVS